MTADQQRKAFRSLLGTTKAKGTGLGLAIVARIIEAHHGDIKIKAREGRGTTVTVTLPIAT
jgi:two-component system sensor histidine kinase HydH